MARRRNLLAGATLVMLIALVALASRAHTATGGGGTHRIDGSLVLEYLLLAILAGAAVVLCIVAWTLWRSRKDGEELPARGNWMRQVLVAATVVMLIAGGIAIYRSTQDDGQQATSTVTHAGSKPRAKAPTAAAAKKGTGTARFDWVPAIVVFSTVLCGCVAGFLLLRRRPAPPRAAEAELAARLSAVLDDSLDDLRAERDPRRAVIAAYARMERVCGLAGLPRRAAEAPIEYLTRILHDLLSASASSVSRLTALFERAKFSRHEIDAGMKEEAIAALAAVRDELRAATP
jgi:NADH:ubiquinone oxidoreductase subunit 6 (subunit J)